MTVQGDEALRRRFKAISDTRQLLGEVALLGKGEALRLYVAQSRRTGNLGRTIRVGTVTATSAQVIAGGTSNVGYARYVEEGTGLYGPRRRKIVPRNKKVLRWKAGGSRVTGRGKGSSYIYARSVKGRKATPYLVPGVKKAVDRAGLDVVVTAWNDAA